MVLAVALYVAAPLAALALRDLTDDVLAHRAGPALAAAVLASSALVAQLMLAHFCHLDLSRVSGAKAARGDGPDGPAAAPAEGGERAAGCPGIRSSEAKWLAMGVDGWTSSR